MNVLVISVFPSGPKPRKSVCQEFAERLRESGWQVYTASAKKGRAARLLDMLAACWKHRHDFDAAYVEVFSGTAFIWAEIVCRVLSVLGRPYILALHGGNLPVFARRRDARVRRLLHSAAAVTAPSRYLLEAMCSYRHDVILLPNALDLGSYRFRVRKPAGPRLVWVRAFHQMYNPQLAIQALRLLVPRFPEVRLTMVGPDKGDGSLQATRALAEREGLAGHVAFAGAVHRDEIPFLLDDADIFVNTTNVDNTPVSVLEAMAAGLCVISTDVGGIPYLVEDRRHALLIPPGDVGRLASAILEVLEDDSLAGRLSKNGRELVEPFDWSVILPRWQGLFTAAA
jgi:glycosyltransferase involved in cell wall biosynthesis